MPKAMSKRPLKTKRGIEMSTANWQLRRPCHRTPIIREIIGRGDPKGRNKNGFGVTRIKKRSWAVIYQGLFRREKKIKNWAGGRRPESGKLSTEDPKINVDNRRGETRKTV